MAKYPPKNCRIRFLEPFPRAEYEGLRRKYYIKAVIDNCPESELRMGAKQQLDTIDLMLLQDRKLTDAVVECKDGQFYVVSRSPQLDFFGAVKEE